MFVSFLKFEILSIISSNSLSLLINRIIELSFLKKKIQCDLRNCSYNIIGFKFHLSFSYKMNRLQMQNHNLYEVDHIRATFKLSYLNDLI